ncbi:Transketolase, N-terminal section [Actinokineospora spheciospongiae]|uniref:Transketolase, N-terminal section n=1 Tax=Actinokineospora spheciospongiae TaxID=909613 RepID=W7IKG1_9PSEU|nr:thiamine pyrophosphate-dependent enzyme [Actinokineospora spheciospongiae]EWC61350.1 Transketolase, N-terminal section [Actinokineospora spheciospongiae]PWW62620.1 transketolase [Actinokineospora spheciospongiae]
MNTYAELPALYDRLIGDEKHHLAATSTLDVLWVLYDRVLRVDPAHPDAPDRDRFLLSKGHGPMAYYAILAAKGFFEKSTLDNWLDFGSILGYHPDRTLVPGVEIGSGSLGHGLPIALGQAIGLSGPRVFVLLGDGELDEGSNHEAIAVAGRRGQANLTAVVVDNASATHGWPGGIAARFAVEGWVTATADGRDHDALERALTTDHPDAPLAVVAEIREN